VLNLCGAGLCRTSPCPCLHARVPLSPPSCEDFRCSTADVSRPGARLSYRLTPDSHAPFLFDACWRRSRKRLASSAQLNSESTVPTGDVSSPDLRIRTIPSNSTLFIFTFGSPIIASSLDARTLSLTYSTVPLASNTSVFCPKD
jgi:hypothetical protein